MVRKRETTPPGVVPSVVMLLLITAVLLGIISAIFTLTVATAVCDGRCDPAVRVATVNAYDYLAWGMFVVAAVLTFLLRARRWWFVIPVTTVVLTGLLALILGVIAGFV